MHRREALKNVAFLLGGAISASTMGVLFESFTLPENEKNSVSFALGDEKIFAEFADVIVPTTKSSAGAKAAGLGKFIPMMMQDCYPREMQYSFAKGFRELQEKAKKDFGKNYLSLTVPERTKLMVDLRLMAIAQKETKAEENKDLVYFFVTARDLTLLGYYASEIGCTKAREYVLIPGRYDGNAKLKPGQRSWAT
ncbi:gluconate 2-dehydrogenase subunit 3 family protein [Pedobacter endophyticus]|uniref:Gluconate 2-dehydrogenase subunit 3 family protein n=1 Tax=Pedobacter endophyticus TaxID=2789740 RepID=A0A7S9KYB7_9SPHI|nr:gluconate 2-dehydrogenase subunit 3 family protein [Pedobacter endophyticus]QPH39085.1 gluconate 2-dehydrogenase subunit 3 family protein [Pedobacter endophyticus]